MEKPGNKKSPNISVGAFVLEAGIEPARPKTLDFESSEFNIKFT
ncbi:hypothetical protein AEQU1_00631 [Aequorivita sp. CIP111184]|nr:hypothetical protein AEQU1_00631 [Aequorivita sp. CIP111184]